MAKVKIQGHASGSGILTITAPNTSTDRTITLPDATGTLLITAPVTALNNATANELVTVGSTTTELDAESGLTFNGTVLHTNAGTSGASTHAASRIRIEDDTHCGLEITTPNTSEQYIMFSDPQGQAGEIKYNHATDLMQFNSTASHKFIAGGTERLEITSDGRGLSQFTAKAWVKMEGGGPSFTDSHNASSITDYGTGNHGINLSNAMANSNYAVMGNAGLTEYQNLRTVNVYSYATSLFKFGTTYVDGISQDCGNINLLVFGD